MVVWIFLRQRVECLKAVIATMAATVDYHSPVVPFIPILFRIGKIGDGHQRLGDFVGIIFTLVGMRVGCCSLAVLFLDQINQPRWSLGDWLLIYPFIVVFVFKIEVGWPNNNPPFPDN